MGTIRPASTDVTFSARSQDERGRLGFLAGTDLCTSPIKEEQRGGD